MHTIESRNRITFYDFNFNFAYRIDFYIVALYRFNIFLIFNWILKVFTISILISTNDSHTTCSVSSLPCFILSCASLRLPMWNNSPKKTNSLCGYIYRWIKNLKYAFVLIIIYTQKLLFIFVEDVERFLSIFKIYFETDFKPCIIHLHAV